MPTVDIFEASRKPFTTVYSDVALSLLHSSGSLTLTHFTRSPGWRFTPTSEISNGSPAFATLAPARGLHLEAEKAARRVARAVC